MGVRTWKSLLAVGLGCAVLLTSAPVEAQGRGQGAGMRPPAATIVAQRTRPQRETAFAAGYEDGLEKGQADGRQGERYDPVRHRDYRDAERGYTESYGSRDAYRDNYRAGFRQGYEEGYRAGSRNRN